MTTEKWCNLMSQKLQNKRIALIGGASSSGKSFCSQKLKEHLEKQGKRVALIPADMYYKGIAATIVEKVFVNNKAFLPYVNLGPQMVKMVRGVIVEDAFGQKMKDENKQEIEAQLCSIVPNDVAKNFVSALEQEFANINFDEPFAINFKRLVHDINTLIRGGDIIVPNYSFRTGEITFEEKNRVRMSDYDMMIVEGLYTLRPELTEHIDNTQVVKSAVDCDLKTLLIRRFNRDIKSDRCTFTPEQTIVMFLTKVMPAYYDYIYPRLKNADIVFDTGITKEEIAMREKTTQIKFETNREVFNLLKFNGAKLLGVENHKDYFLEDTTRTNQQGISIRMREQNGLATNLSIKLDTANQEERAVEDYDLVQNLSEQNRNVELLLTRFEDSGFDVMQVINKTRRTYDLDGVIIKVDEVKNLGYFVELEGKNALQKQKIADALLLENARTDSYYDLYKQNLTTLSHVESEMKFVVHGLNEKMFERYSSKFIAQYYLPHENEQVLKLIAKTFGQTIPFAIGEARVRVVNGKDYYLTIKSEGTTHRNEMEKEIPVSLAKHLTSHAQKSVQKTRYLLLKSPEKVVEFDFYKDRDLCVMEIEYNRALISDEQVEHFANNVLKTKATVQNVTNDKSYKNKNLAK